MNKISAFLILIIIVITGCSTSRDNFFSRTYHQTTAKYNGYFNAKESVKAGLKKIENEHKENFQNIIPIDKINRIELKGQVFPNMDRAIEKTTRVITLHSMEINNKEKNKWIEDNYFLMAQARYYKKEYLASLNTFKFITRSYSSGELVNKSLIWSAKCDIRLDNLQTAKKTLQTLLDEKKLTKEELLLVYLGLSEVYINEKNYKQAVNYLEKAQKTNQLKELKPRVFFILAQLYERLQNGDKALENYNNVIKSNPDYEMSFRASLNKANSYAYSSGDPQNLLKDYNKMLKDIKNIEYRDQIYFAIAEIKLNEGDTVEAVDNYNKSLSSFLFNINQKLQTHFKLSEIYLNQKEYKSAYIQHDSILMLMDSGDERYVQTKRAHSNLNDVVINQDIIQEKDSLLALAFLTEEERNQKIDDYIEALKLQDMEKKEQEKENNFGSNFNQYEFNRNQATLPTGGGWYFYNPTAMSFGYSEFLTRWGNRKNENNWRRKNKNQMDEENPMGLEEVDGPSLKEKYSREYYLSKIPITKEQQDSTYNLIEKAYYNLGSSLKNKFYDYNQSIYTYETMLSRFNETEYKLLVFMQLVFLYDLLEVETEKQKVLQKIKKEFPNNKYINASTGELLAVSKEGEGTEYEKIYKLYINKNYNDALELTNKALKTLNPDSLNIKMIQAFCISKTRGKKDFITALENIKNLHPNTKQGEESAELLDVLYGSFYENEKDIYKMEPNSEHYMILTVTDLKIDIPELQNMIIKYNNKNFNSKKLEINNVLLNKETQIIKINKFKNKLEATSYLESTLIDKDWVGLYAQKGIDKMIISKSNFVNLLGQKLINEYKIYYQEKYLD